MLKIFNQSHEAVGYIKKYRDYKIENVLSTAEKTLSFTYLAKSQKIDYEYYIQTADAEYVVKAIRLTSDGYPEYTATLNMEGLEAKTWETFLAKDSSLRDAANLALVGTGWRVAECTVDKKRSVGLQNVTSKVVLQKLCTVFMCEMQVDSKAKTVSFKEKFGEDKGVYFLRGLNLRQLTLSGDTYDFYTRIIPVGKDNLKITSVNNGKEYIDNFQYSKKIIPYVWQDTSYEDAATLMEDATEKLKDLSIPKKSYTVDVRDLAYRSAEYGILEYNLGDTITLIDRKNGIRDKQRITKITEYPENPDKNTCDIANTRETFDEIQSRLKEAASIVEAAKNLDGSLNGVVDKVTTDQILGFKDSVESEIQNSSTITAIAGEISATKAQIGTIESTYLKTTEADIKYATIDLANIKDASIKTAMIDVGAVNTAQIADGSITDAKIIELTANKITTGTLSVERLEIRGSNRSIVYALNNITGALQAQNVDTLNGEILTQRTITADKIVASSITGNEIAAKTILANHIDVIDLFAQKIEATDLHVVGNSTIDGNLIASGTISADRLDVNGIFAKDITATGTISGATLKGASGQFTGTVDAQTLYVKDKIQIYASSYSSAVTILEETKEDDINNLILGSYSYGSIISRNQISAPSLYVSENITVLGNISASKINGVTWNWSGQGGQPNWLWGGNDGVNMYVYSPSNFSVSYAAKAGNISGAVAENGITFKSGSNQTYMYQTGNTITFMTSSDGGKNNAYPLAFGADHSVSDPGSTCGINFLSGNSWKAITPHSGDNTIALGMSGYRYTRLYAASATISTSDENEKNILSGITGAYEKTFLNLKPILYRWKNNDAKKHDRVHCGLGAQSVLSAAKENGLTTLTFAAICRDDLEEPTADGRMERWGIAYEELIPLTIHMTQKAFEKIENVERSMNELNKENMKISFLQSQIEQLCMCIGELQAKIQEKEIEIC